MIEIDYELCYVLDKHKTNLITYDVQFFRRIAISNKSIGRSVLKNFIN